MHTYQEPPSVSPCLSFDHFQGKIYLQVNILIDKTCFLMGFKKNAFILFFFCVSLVCLFLFFFGGGGHFEFLVREMGKGVKIVLKT